MKKNDATKCPECGKQFRIPPGYKKSHGKCPGCGKIIKVSAQIKKTKNESVENRVSLYSIPDDIHPLVFLMGKHKDRLKQYGDGLQNIYKLIRNQMLHKKDFEKQKLLLKKEVFTEIIKDAVRLPDFSFTIDDRINQWMLLFTILPFTDAELEPDAVKNLYPRYEYASITCLCYALGGFKNAALKAAVMRKAVKGEHNTPGMKKIFKEIIESPYGDEFLRRIKRLLDETRQLPEKNPGGMTREFKQMEDDFNFGFSWAAFHLPS